MVYNWKAVTAYLKDKARQLRIFTASFNLALAVTLFVAAGTLLEIPPMSTLVSIGNSITDRANRKYGEPPYGHAELSSLRMFARKTDLDLDKAEVLLQKAGIRFKDSRQTVLEIAKANGITPKALYQIMKPASNRSEKTGRFPDDLAWFLMTICRCDYRHEPRLAPSQEILDGYKKKKIPWEEYEKGFLEMLKRRSGFLRAVSISCTGVMWARKPYLRN